VSRSEEKRLYYLENKDRIDDRNKKYNKENSEKINSYRRLRRKEDPQFALTLRIRERISKAVTRGQKSGSAILDMGCSVDFLKNYLESKFKPGMNWENYGKGAGKWNIDHVVPLFSFNLADREQFLKAVNYTNLQPLWSEENLRKGIKL